MRPRLGVPGLDARRRGTGVTPLANFRVDRSLPVPGGARPEGRERPGQARPHLPGSTLRPPRTKLCGLPVPEPACGSVPAALRGRRLCTARGAPADPGRSPSSRRRGARPAWPHPCQSPRGHAHLRSAPFRVAFAVTLRIALWLPPALSFRCVLSKDVCFSRRNCYVSLDP